MKTRVTTIIVLVLALSAFAGVAIAQETEPAYLPSLNMESLSVFALTFLIPGIVETCKKVGLKGNAPLFLSIGLGVLFTGLGEAINQELISGIALVWIRLVVMSLAGGLSASGYYDLLLRPIRDRLNGS